MTELCQLPRQINIGTLHRKLRLDGVNAEFIALREFHDQKLTAQFEFSHLDNARRLGALVLGFHISAIAIDVAGNARLVGGNHHLGLLEVTFGPDLGNLHARIGRGFLLH